MPPPRRAGTELSLIVLDLDRFSAVNNEHGHAVGDAVLRRVAQAMVSAVRTATSSCATAARSSWSSPRRRREAPSTRRAIRAAVADADRRDGPLPAHASDRGRRIDSRAGLFRPGSRALVDEVGRAGACSAAADSALLAAKRARVTA